MSERAFIDYYEVLQLSPNASTEMVERVYRMLAKRYHPDNQDTGDPRRFAEVHQAFEVLSSPKARAAYDLKYDESRSVAWQVFKQDTAGVARDDDRRLSHGILSLLYIARRRDPHKGGMGPISLEKLLGCPQQDLEFPLWYLKQRGWIERLENGFMAITADGIDKLQTEELSLPANRLLPAAASGGMHVERSTAP